MNKSTLLSNEGNISNSKHTCQCGFRVMNNEPPYVGEYKVPTSAVTKDDLLKAGLGEKNIEFSSLDIPAEEFRDVIYDNFPKLRNGGGFELCRSLPNSRHLEPLSSAAYSSPQLLKERVGNSRTYIRPLQRDLDLEEVFGLPGGVCIAKVCIVTALNKCI